MLIKFESKKAASFSMQSEVAQRLLSMIGQGGKSEGSISGASVDAALSSLDGALTRQEEAAPQSDDGEEEAEQVSVSARAAPLREMLRHAQKAQTYVMWRPE